MKKIDKGLIVKTILSLLLIPVILFVVWVENGEITLIELAHWLVHIIACTLVCETIHSWWHRHDNHKD